MLKEDNVLFDNLRTLINIIDKLRDIGVGDYISLPRIAVLGTQSAGKSSLLEAISGLNFLPRGDGVVTRRPLELRMNTTVGLSEPYGVFVDFPNEKITNMDKIREKIIELTNKICGEKKFISDDPIVLSIYSENVPDLTLIDLPGIAKTAQDDQPENIEELTVNLVKKYCEDEYTVIISVNPANQDLATTDGIKYAKKFDPTGERTLGVITKIDIMDEGTDATKVLTNNEIKLKYGYVGVKGRSKKEVNENIKVEEALKREKKFFDQHPIYSKLDYNLLGTYSLINKLTGILHNLIKKNLPDIKFKISKKKKEAENILQKLGPEIPVEENKKFEYIFKLIQNYVNLINSEVTGKIDLFNTKNYNNLKNKKKTVSSKIRKDFDEFIEEQVEEDFSISKNYSDEDIKNALNKYQGDSIEGFLSKDSFLSLIIPNIKKFRIPINELLDNTSSLMTDMSKSCLKNVFSNHSKILNTLNDLIIDYINKKKRFTSSFLESMFEAEEGYLFTNQNLLNKLNYKYEKKDNDSFSGLILELRLKIDNYYYLVSNNIKDYVPKIIGTFLIKSFLDEISIHIFSELSKNNFFVDLIKEKEEITNERNNLKKKISTLYKAEQMLLIEMDNNMNNYEIDEFENLEKKNEEFYKESNEIYNDIKENEPVLKEEIKPEPVRVNTKPNINSNPVVNRIPSNSNNVNKVSNNNNNADNNRRETTIKNETKQTENNPVPNRIFGNNPNPNNSRVQRSEVNNNNKFGNLFGNFNK